MSSLICLRPVRQPRQESLRPPSSRVVLRPQTTSRLQHNVCHLNAYRERTFRELRLTKNTLEVQRLFTDEFVQAL